MTSSDNKTCLNSLHTWYCLFYFKCESLKHKFNNKFVFQYCGTGPQSLISESQKAMKTQSFQ